jgi:hypothetical protein
VTKPTNNTTRAPITNGLISTTARALVYTAELPDLSAEPVVVVVVVVVGKLVVIPDEPDVQQEQGIEDPLLAYHLPEAFNYTLV